MLLDAIFSVDGLLNLTTLTGLEIVLGIDNVIFIALLVHHLPINKRNPAKFIGLSLALILRIVMLLGAAWIIKLRDPLFSLFGFALAGRNILLIIGGGFLIIKAIFELKELFDDSAPDPAGDNNMKKKYINIITQIIFVDLILSFDSIITAVGMTDEISVIITAIVIAMIVMIMASEKIGEFIYRHPSIKVIALAFIGLVGVMLVSNGLNIDFPKSFLYMTMFFSIFVEVINIKLENKKDK